MAHLFTPVKKEEDVTEEQDSGNPNPFGILGDMLGISQKQQIEPKPEPQYKVNPVAHSPEEHLENQAENDKFFNEKFPGDEEKPKKFDIESALESLRGTANYEKLKSRIKLLTPAQQKAAVEYAIKCQDLLKKKKEEKEKAENDAKIVGAGALGGDFSQVAVVSQSDVEDSQLLDAVRNGRTEELMALISKYKRTASTSVIAKGDAEAHPLLHWAALEDQLETLKVLMSMGADPNTLNPRGECAIHWACIRGHIRCVHLLLTSGSRIDVADERGYSPMHHAAQFGRTVVMAMLHRRGAPVDIRDNHGRTPLHWAAYKGERFAVQWLLNHGADISAEDWENCMPMHWAALQGLMDICTVLMKNGGLRYLDRKDKTGYTAGELALNKSKRFDEKSHDYKRYQRVGAYLEQCRKKKKDTASQNTNSMHWSWYLWPLLAPIAFYQYYVYMMPVTIYLYPYTNLLLWIGYWGLWWSWLILQVKDPGYITLDKRASVMHKKGFFNYLMFCYNVSGITSDAHKFDNTNDETSIAIDPNVDTRYTVPNPAVKDSQLFRELYDEVLDRGLLVPVCTHCEIVKPLRSKHDRFTDRCVDKFDHYCPWVGVAIGRNNYKPFVWMLFSGFFCMNAWMYLVIVYTSLWNEKQSWLSNSYDLGWWTIFGWFFAPIALYATIMSFQHGMFVLQNISTNEMINKFRYQYLANGQNPFSRGRITNVAEFLGIANPVDVNIRRYYSHLFSGGTDRENLFANFNNTVKKQAAAYGQRKGENLSVFTNPDVSVKDVQLSTLPVALNNV